jgi:recombination protein RecA
MERDKALEMALGQITKQYGEGAVMRMDDSFQVKVPAIPTGAISLDLALGIGGIPRGRVIEVYGPESSGKCVVADTYVWTDHGLETVAEVFERCGQPASCTSRITDIRDQDVRAVNEHGELEQVAALTHNGNQLVRRITLKSGRSVEATHNHPFRVLSDGWIVWKETGELEEGDVVVSALFGGAEAVGASDLSEDEGVLLGYLIAEGCLSGSTPHQFFFSNAHDPDVAAEVTRLGREVLGVEAKLSGHANYVFTSRQARETLRDRYGLGYGLSADKHIPHCVRTAGPKIQAAFLSALYEGDGWVERGPEIGYTSASRTLAEQLQLLLYGLGIPATLSTKRNKTYDRDYYTVLIGPAGVRRFLDTIGFRSARRAEQVERHATTITERSSVAENIPGLWPLLDTLRKMIGGDRTFDRLAGDLRRDGHTDCSRQRLRAIVDWAKERVGHNPGAEALLHHLRALADANYTFERIIAIEDAGEKPTFDVSLPGSHSFLANGILSHNTSLALHMIAETQKAGGIAAFIDAEHALDPTYAKAIGVDMEELLVSQPDTGEQALEITDMLIRSGAIDIVVIDSVAALTPRAEIEGEMGDSHVGLQARLMSQALRKLSGNLHRSKTSAVFINQLREKIGVLFGCVSADTRVTLADGSQEKIGKMVKERLPVEVLSYDPRSGRVVAKKVTNWFDNGPTDEFLHFKIARSGPTGRGKASFACTANHKVRTPSGWREADDLRVGDKVIQAVPHFLSESQWEVVLGGLMGDSALSRNANGYAARLRFGHGAKQVRYADWKASLFANLTVCRSTNEQGAVFHDVQPLAELAELREAVYIGGKKVLSWDYLKRLTPLSLAVWYMDDASFRLRSQGVQERTRGGSGRAEIVVEAMEPSSRTRLAEYLRDEWGIDSKLFERAGKAVLQFPTAETDKLQALIAPYVHPSMEYKLLPRHRGQFAVEPAFAPVRYEPVPMPILSIERRRTDADSHRYDIEVDGTHNYFVDGVMVHNSPETQPGGRALKFYSSVRLDIRRIESLKDGTDFVGNRVRVKVVKNKCVAAGTRVYDPTTGLTHKIEDIVDHGAGGHVWAADKEGRLHIRPIKARMDQGEQDVITLCLGSGTSLRVTPDHLILTEAGWRQAGELRPGDRVARPRSAGTFGTHEPLGAVAARSLGETACSTTDRPLPAEVFASDVSEGCVANVLLGAWEGAGWITHRHSAGLQCGFRVASEQVAWQVHWLLLRWGIVNAVAPASPGRRRADIDADKGLWRVTITGLDNVRRFSKAIPMAGGRGQLLLHELGHLTRRHTGSGSGLLSASSTEPVLDWLRTNGVTATRAAQIVGVGSPEAGLRGVLGRQRLRRDRMKLLAQVLDSEFLRGVLVEDVYYDRVREVLPAEPAATFDIEVEELHNFVADDVVVHNCASPFKTAEFDILFGEGISKEGSLIDVGVEHGIVKKAGAWYTYDGEQLGQGRENARNFLKEHPDTAEEIAKKINEALGLVPTDVVGEEGLAAVPDPPEDE